MKSFLAGLALLFYAAAAHAQSVAFTFDDGPRLDDTPLLTPRQRNQAMLDALARHQVQAALFVTVCRTATGGAKKKPRQPHAILPTSYLPNCRRKRAALCGTGSSGFGIPSKY